MTTRDMKAWRSSVNIAGRQAESVMRRNNMDSCISSQH